MEMECVIWDIYSLSRIDDTLDTLADYKLLPMLDMKISYAQVELNPKKGNRWALTCDNLLKYH